DPMRRTVFDYLPAAPAVRRVFDVPVSWGSWVVPVGLELALVAVFGIATLGVAIANFSKVD
ncbi:MAG TPA: ABC transporter, partial [Acidimicrobiales bacterium]|nr:ABC transporter [Acidimicrobiales bacterium]